MLRIAALLLALGVSTDLLAQTAVVRGPVGSSMPTMNTSNIPLNPGERLLAVNGVPVRNATAPVAVSGSNPYRMASAQRGVPMQQSMPTQQSFGGSRGGLIVNRDPAAYAHAVREAQILASRGENYHRYGDGGHPLGIAPGCRYSGTGYSRDPNRPNHCYYGEMPDSRLVARAMVPGPNGTYYWSAHYR